MPDQYHQAMAAAFEDELKKIAHEKKAGLSPSTMKMLGTAGAGAIAYETLRRAESDRRMGKMIRRQQGQNY